jgi:multiple sugar transport system substrate-binding protein
MSLTQPVDEVKYEKGLGEVKNVSEFSPRLIVVLSLGVVAIVLLIVFMIRFRKH